MPTVAITLVSWESEATLERCLEAVSQLSPPPDEVVTLDNGSRDRSLSILRRSPVPTQVIAQGENLGFAQGQNRAIQASGSDVVLCLNPDTIPTPGFIGEALAPFEADPRVGMVSGKLLRTTDGFAIPDDPAVIDSTGIVWTRNGRHLDRGADEADTGQYETEEEIFGPSGAAAFYRRSMLEEIAFEGQYFDEDFESYREDADLAWRARLFGFRGWYRPSALTYHRRRVTPERRSVLTAAINRSSVRNRFLLRLKNEGWGLFARNGLRELARDALVIGYVLLAEWSSLPALGDVVRTLPRTLAKRRWIQGRRQVSDADLAIWFGGRA